MTNESNPVQRPHIPEDRTVPEVTILALLLGSILSVIMGTPPTPTSVSRWA